MTKKLRERWKAESQQMYVSEPEKDAKKSAGFEIYKTDDDQHLVFGWASVAITVTGEELEDRQHDIIDPADLEEAAYEYVLNFRDTGEEHLPGYRKKGKLVESCVFTPEKQRAMGIPAGTLPVAWWIGFKIDDEDTWRRVKDGTYKMFSIEGKAQREPVEKADSTAMTFDEVLKFNPFHDAAGRFSSAQGMRTFSANPKTKAGAMAIGRSNQDHGHVMNVHRESKGENIRQNFDWITSGNKPWQNAAGAAKPTAAAPKQTTKPKPQAKPKDAVNEAENGPKSGSGKLAAQVASVKLSSSDKLALQARNMNGEATTTKKVANDHYQDRVEGKDISKTFDYSKMKTKKAPIDAIAEAHGWNKAPTVTNDREEFDKAAKQAGRVLIRTVHDAPGQTATEVARSTMTDGNYALGGHGLQAYGSGRYMVDTRIKGNSLTAKRVADGQAESFWYGDKQMMATVHPKAKIATPTQSAELKNEFHNLPSKERAKFGQDANTYIASKGYDGARWHNENDPTGYTTMFNNSAMIYYGGVASNY